MLFLIEHYRYKLLQEFDEIELQFSSNGNKIIMQFAFHTTKKYARLPTFEYIKEKKKQFKHSISN